MIDLASLKLFKPDSVQHAVQSSRKGGDEQPADKFQDVLSSVQQKSSRAQDRKTGAAQTPAGSVTEQPAATKSETAEEVPVDAEDHGADDAEVVAEQGVVVAQQPQAKQPDTAPAQGDNSLDVSTQAVTASVEQPQFAAELEEFAPQPTTTRKPASPAPQPTPITQAPPPTPEAAKPPPPAQAQAPQVVQPQAQEAPQPRAEVQVPVEAPVPVKAEVKPEAIDKPAPTPEAKAVKVDNQAPATPTTTPVTPYDASAQQQQPQEPQQQPQEQQQQHEQPLPKEKPAPKSNAVLDTVDKANTPAAQGADAATPVEQTAPATPAPVFVDAAAPTPTAAPAPVDTHAQAVAPAQHAAPSTEDSDQPRIAEQALRGLRAVINNQRGGSLTLRLNPPELGELRIKVDLTNNIVRANFEASSESTRSLLQQQISTLRSALEGHGLRVDQLLVQTPNQSFQQDLSQQHRGSEQATDGRSRGSFEQGQGGGSPRQDQPSQDTPKFQQELLDLVA